MRTVIVAAAVAILVTACAADGPARDVSAEDPSAGETTVTTAAPPSSISSTTPPTSTTTVAPGPTCKPDTAGSSRAGFDTAVLIALPCGAPLMPLENLVLVERVVPDDGEPLAAAIGQLLLGVTPAEAEAGLISAFSSYTAGEMNSVDVVDGVAIIDVTRAFLQTNNFSTSNLSGVVQRQIAATVFQFAGIDAIELTVDGSRFCGWEQTCEDAPGPFGDRSTAVAPADDYPPPRASVRGWLDVRFVDDSRDAIEFCVVHPDPTLGVVVSTCANSVAAANTNAAALPYDVDGIEFEYFRGDVAAALVRVDPRSLPLEFGDRGDAVALVQQGLEGFCLHIAEDVLALRPGEEFPASSPGDFDDITEFMVRRFQAAAGLPITGRYDEMTHSLLLQAAVDETPENAGCFA